MKKSALLLIILCTVFNSLYAQNLQKEDIIVLDENIKAILREISPIFINLEKKLNRVSFPEAFSTQLVDNGFDLPEDTTWTYTEEGKGLIFNPKQYRLNFYLGDTLSDYTYFDKQYSWSGEDLEWNLAYVKKMHFSSGHNDSTITHVNSSVQFSYKLITPAQPSEGASFEQIRQVLKEDNNAKNYWIDNSRDLIYKDESGRDTLKKHYRFNRDLDVFEIYSVNRNWETDGFNNSSTEYYSKGVLVGFSSLDKTNKGKLIIFSEFDSQGVQIGGKRIFTSFDEMGRTVYQEEKRYRYEDDSFISVDSLHFAYSEDGELIEALEYVLTDSGWVINNAYNTFQSLKPSGEFLVDSIVVFELNYNPETEELERGKVIKKTLFEYDNAGNQTSMADYNRVENSLKMTYKYEMKYQQLIGSEGTPYYATTKFESFFLNQETGQLYLSGSSEFTYDSTIAGSGYVLAEHLSFDINGEIRDGYLVDIDTLLDDGYLRKKYEWDTFKKEMVLKNYEVIRKPYVSGKVEIFNQSSEIWFQNGEAYTLRSFTSKQSYPGVFNDGPISVSLGDTISLFVSGLNPDLTFPEIEILNMPVTSSFDPETRHFFWIVDEASPSPMTYKAIRGENFVTAEVEFVNEQFTVGTQTEENPIVFRLSQNYPNPFNPATSISFNLPEAGEVSLKVYNLLGQEVASIVNGRMNAGFQQVNFDASNLASGTYIYRLVAGTNVQTRKMMLIK